MKFQSLFLIVYVILSSCNGLNNEGKNLLSINDKRIAQNALSIIIQPFDGIPEASVTIVAEKLKEIYTGAIVINHSIPLPQKALNLNKKRHRADSLIRYLATFAKPNQVIIGLTHKDISTTKGKNKDYGIMGLGFSPGKSCIVSTFKLKGKNRQEKLFKVVIHELAHTQGLAKTSTKHCPEKSCFMRDAEGKDHLNELKYFCSN